MAKSTKIISSNHYDQSPGSTNEIIEEIDEISGSGNIIKIVFNTAGKKDALKLFDIAWRTRDSKDKLSIMGIGAGGDWTRIHAPLLNQSMVYTTMENGWYLAQQGKINTSDLKTAWKLLLIINGTIRQDKGSTASNIYAVNLGRISLDTH